MVGLIGTATELRIDISRLPRVDQYQGATSGSGQLSVADIPSDVKTIAYFVVEELPSTGAKGASASSSGPIAPSATGRGRGLMRSETSRAVASWNETNGTSTSIYDGGKLLADEVVGVAFQYYDGTTWVPEWDSTTMCGLPRAVEIVLTIQPTYAMSESALAKSSASKATAEQSYRLVVNLPSAALVAATTTTDASSGTAATTGTAAAGTTAASTSQGATP